MLLTQKAGRVAPLVGFAVQLVCSATLVYVSGGNSRPSPMMRVLAGRQVGMLWNVGELADMRFVAARMHICRVRMRVVFMLCQ